MLRLFSPQSTEICIKILFLEVELENDEDLFTGKAVSSDKGVKWKFIGDCAFLLSETEHDSRPIDNVDDRSRKR